MKKSNDYNIEQELMEAFVLEKTDAEIGMPDIDAELRRVHGIAEKRTNLRRRRLLKISSIAACIAVVVGVGFLRYANTTTKGDNLCIAYVGGTCITDEAEVMQLMSMDMTHMNSENEILEDQLSIMFNE